MNEKIQIASPNPINSSGVALAVEQTENVFSGKLHVKVLDWTPGTSDQAWKQQLWESSTTLKSALDQQRRDVGHRIISFHSSATCLPLKASWEDFLALQRRYDINSEFLNTLAAFGRFPDPANGYAVTPTISRNYASGMNPGLYEIWYRLQYPERNHRSTNNPWSIRHTGIYHQYDAQKKFNLIILINPCRDAVLESALFDATTSFENPIYTRLAEDPFSIHQILCDFYLPNWSPCIRDQSKAQEETNDNVQTSDLKTGSLESDFRVTQQLRFLKNATTTNRLLCQDNIAVLDELRDVFKHSASKTQWLNINKAKASARCDSLFLLQERIQNDLDLLEHAATQRDSRINHHNQTIATKLNETLLTLTYNTVDDSATIKIITIFTLIFLPGSFIATIFGMNFFVFEDGSPSLADGSPTQNGLTVGQNFWIFIATWLPVTALVLLIYVSVIWRRMRIVSKRRLAMKTTGGAADGGGNV